jgi:hypothetical protein
MNCRRLFLVWIFLLGCTVSVLFAEPGYVVVFQQFPYNKEIKRFEVKAVKISPDGKQVLASFEKIQGLVYATAPDEKNSRIFFFAEGVKALDSEGRVSAVDAGFPFRVVFGMSFDANSNFLWVTDASRNKVVRIKMKEDTTEVAEMKDFAGFLSPVCVVCDTSDGSVWLADPGRRNPEKPEIDPSWVVKLDKEGNRTKSLKGYDFLQKGSDRLAVGGKAIAVTGDSVFVTDYLNHRVVILSKEGEIKKEVELPFPRMASYDGKENIWILASMERDNLYPSRIVRLSTEGEILLNEKAGYNPLDICATENGCWVATGGKGITFVSSEGKVSVFGDGTGDWELQYRAIKIVVCKPVFTETEKK